MVKRRQLLEVFAKIFLIIFGTIPILSLKSKREYITKTNEGTISIDLKELKLKKVIKLEYKDKPILAIYYNGKIFIYDATCPHMGCPVNAILERKILRCPCHLSKFDLISGERISGPSPRGLDKIPFKISEGKIILLDGQENI
ncbi:MAG: hypothetical protein DRN25_01225 [Thermoplasmata archaeon]|nr:MAG: hypothetical protein DRN25_01225 [Thermoplasmata archaeon]